MFWTVCVILCPLVLMFSYNMFWAFPCKTLLFPIFVLDWLFVDGCGGIPVAAVDSDDLRAGYRWVCSCCFFVLEVLLWRVCDPTFCRIWVVLPWFVFAFEVIGLFLDGDDLFCCWKLIRVFEFLATLVLVWGRLFIMPSSSTNGFILLTFVTAAVYRVCYLFWMFELDIFLWWSTAELYGFLSLAYEDFSEF